MSDIDIRNRRIYRITIWGLAVNLLLFAFKFAAGILGRSGAMVADAVHSASDTVTDIVILVCVKISSAPQDKNHDWGHGKYETLATAVVGLLLAFVSVELFSSSYQTLRKILDGDFQHRPGLIALIAAVFSIITKESLYQVTVKVGKETQSPAVVANAWHHRSDALSSVATMIGIGLAYFLGDKWVIADPIVAAIVALMVLKVAYDLVRQALGDFTERSLPDEIENEILGILLSEPEIEDPHNLRTRRLGSNIAIEVHVRVHGDMTVYHSHEITKKLEIKLKQRFGDMTAVVIHVEPYK